MPDTDIPRADTADTAVIAARPRASVPYRIKSAYAATARSAGVALTRAGVLPEEPPDRAQRWRHWVVSLTRVHDSLAIARLGVPWWTYDAIDAIDAWIAERPGPIRTLEWGTGASTLWLADRVDQVDTIEHHVEFAAGIAPALAEHANVSLHVVPGAPSDDPVVGSHKSGFQGQDFAAYVGVVEDIGGLFDLVVIDGRARSECLDAVLPHLATGALVVFDNSGRRRYRAAIRGSGLVEQRHIGLTPTLPYPDQTSLLRPA